MGAVVGLTGRLVHLAANMQDFTDLVPQSDRERIASVVERIRVIRDDLTRGSVPQPPQSAGESETPPNLPCSVKLNKPSPSFSRHLRVLNLCAYLRPRRRPTPPRRHHSLWAHCWILSILNSHCKGVWHQLAVMLSSRPCFGQKFRRRSSDAS